MHVTGECAYSTAHRDMYDKPVNMKSTFGLLAAVFVLLTGSSASPFTRPSATSFSLFSAIVALRCASYADTDI